MNAAFKTIVTMLLPVLAMSACGGSSNVPHNTVLTPEAQQLGKARVDTTSRPRTPQEAVRAVSHNGSGAVPVIMSRGNNLYLENIFEMQASMELCSSLLADRAKGAKAAKSKEYSSYYCVQIEEGTIGEPALIAKFEG